MSRTMTVPVLVAVTLTGEQIFELVDAGVSYEGLPQAIREHVLEAVQRSAEWTAEIIR